MYQVKTQSTVKESHIKENHRGNKINQGTTNWQRRHVTTVYVTQNYTVSVSKYLNTAVIVKA